MVSHRKFTGSGIRKGIFGIQEMTKIRCRIRGNTKYLDRKQDLTATWEVGFIKIWAQLNYKLAFPRNNEVH